MLVRTKARIGVVLLVAGLMLVVAGFGIAIPAYLTGQSLGIDLHPNSGITVEAGKTFSIELEYFDDGDVSGWNEPYDYTTIMITFVEAGKSAPGVCAHVINIAEISRTGTGIIKWQQDGKWGVKCWSEGANSFRIRWKITCQSDKYWSAKSGVIRAQASRGGNPTDTIPATFTQEQQESYFTLRVYPPSEIMAGTSAEGEVSLTSHMGYNSYVTLTVGSPLPTGVSVVFSPVRVIPSATSKMRIAVVSTFGAGDVSLTVKATGDDGRVVTESASFGVTPYVAYVTITVKVLDAATLEPISGASVLLDSSQLTTSEDGTCSTVTLAGSYGIVIEKTDYKTFSGDITASEDKEFTFYLIEEDDDDPIPPLPWDIGGIILFGIGASFSVVGTAVIVKYKGRSR